MLVPSLAGERWLGNRSFHRRGGRSGSGFRGRVGVGVFESGHLTRDANERRKSKQQEIRTAEGAVGIPSGSRNFAGNGFHAVPKRMFHASNLHDFVNY